MGHLLNGVERGVSGDEKIVSIWPSPFMGNSPKEILLLHELAILLKASGASSGEPVASAAGNNEKEPLCCSASRLSRVVLVIFLKQENWLLFK